MEKYRYTKTWFLGNEINTLLLNYIDQYKQNNILEIGCYEGLSSVYFADNLLEHQNSSLICVDPFLTIDDNDHKNFLVNNEENNFDYNISICKNIDKITVMKITSDKFFENNTKMFNFIYIDGSHENDVVERDLKNSFNFLEKDGIMWMDDYYTGLKNTIDSFLENYKDKIKIIYKGYQLAIKKL